MPPRKTQKPVLPNFKPATSEFTFNTSFRYGLADNPPQLGEIPVPVGAPDCLAGITFTVTGTLRSLTRNDAKELIETYGGRVTSCISGVTDVLIRGVIEVGPKKLADAQKRGLVIIDEDSLFDYLASTNTSWKPPPPKVIEGGTELPYDNFPDSSLFTEHYRPRLLKDVIGNASGIKHLMKFFDEFEKGGKPSVILSGPPGIGKSTCAALVAHFKGYDPIEFNASDTRSAKAIGEDIADVFDNKFVIGHHEKHCLIFDEIDGMSTGDRGGLQKLVKLIEDTAIPVICICNERNSKKLQTLANKSIDIAFTKPLPEYIAQRLRFIADSEKIDISDETLLEIARASQGDIRHAINTLQFWHIPIKENKDQLSLKEQDGKEVPMVDVVEACQKALSPDTTIDQRFDCYFVDYSIIPLYIYENVPVLDNHSYCEAIDSISISDMVQSTTRETTSWNLLNADGLFSTVIPGVATIGKGYPISARFPMWFGKTSKEGRLKRYINEISGRSIKSISSHPTLIYNTTLPLLAERFKHMLSGKKPDAEGFVSYLEELGLTLDDYEHIFELVMLGGDSKNPRKIPVSTSAKTSVSRLYHSRHTDNQKKILPEADVRADYYISERPKGQFSRTSKSSGGSTRRRRRGDYDYDDYDFEAEEEYDGEFVLGKSSKTKKSSQSNKKSTAKTTKGKKSNDDDSDLDGFIVDDDEYDEKPKKKRTKKQETPKKQKEEEKKQVNWKPTKTVRRKKPVPKE